MHMFIDVIYFATSIQFRYKIISIVKLVKITLIVIKKTKLIILVCKVLSNFEVSRNIKVFSVKVMYGIKMRCVNYSNSFSK